MAHWVGAQGQAKLAKKSQKHPHCRDITPRKPQTQNEINFFNLH